MQSPGLAPQAVTPAPRSRLRRPPALSGRFWRRAGCVIPPRRSRALCGGCGGVLGGQSVQYAAAVFGGDGLLHKGLELLLGQRDGVGQQLLDKPHALAEAVRPVLALLLFLLLDKPLFLVCNGTKSKISHSPLTISLE